MVLPEEKRHPRSGVSPHTPRAGFAQEGTEGVGINQQGCKINKLNSDLGFAEGLKTHAIDFVSSLTPHHSMWRFLLR